MTEIAAVLDKQQKSNGECPQTHRQTDRQAGSEVWEEERKRN